MAAQCAVEDFTAGAGTIQFKQETVEVKTLVDHAAEHLLIPMELKEQTFSAEIPEGLH